MGRAKAFMRVSLDTGRQRGYLENQGKKGRQSEARGTRRESWCTIASVDSEEKDPEYAKLNKILAKKFKGNPNIAPKHPTSKPNRPDNKLVY